MSDIADRLTAALADRYRLERELGQGGMATVYLADDLKHERKVAIKVLRPELAHALGPERFLREIRIAAQLQHPHILPLLESGEADGFLYYVMPYVKGQSLRDRLSREGELPVTEAVRLLTEVVDALALAHEHGVVHRDIKPDNVMLSGRHALVMDFGVAKAISEAARGGSITTLGIAVGTPAYMSPEQAAADPHVDHRSDIYSVGVMAYEMLTGAPPFTGTTPQQVLAAQVSQAPDPVSKHRASIPPALEQVVMKCLAKRPADRFQSAAELHSALEPLSTPSLGTTPTATRPVEPNSRRRLGMMVGVAAIAAIATATVVIYTRRDHNASAPTVYDRIRLTNTGAASSPAVSPDGRQVAYASRTCDEVGTCLSQVIVTDITTGTRQTIIDSLDTARPERWSPDGAWILVVAHAEGRGLPWATYLVSHLGGAVTHLGDGGDFTPTGDTVLVSTGYGMKGTIYLRSFVAPWSQAVDSVAITRPDSGRGVEDFRLSPNGRWIAVLWAWSDTNPCLLSIHDRGGAIISRTDLLCGRSIRWAGPSSIVSARYTETNEAIVDRIDIDLRTGAFGRLDQVALAASSGPQMPNLDLSANGNTLAYDVTQAGEQELWTLEKAPGRGGFEHQVRHLPDAAAAHFVDITPDGRTVLYFVQTPASTSGHRTGQWFAAPFRGGPGRAITPPNIDYFGHTLTTDGHYLLVAAKLPNGHSRITKFALAGGHATNLGDHPTGSYDELWQAGADGFAIARADSGSIETFDRAGREVRRVVVPDSLKEFKVRAASPTGDGWIVSATLRNAPTGIQSDGNFRYLFFRVSSTGTWTFITSARLGWKLDGERWTTDGLFNVIAKDALHPRLAMYSVPVSAGVMKRGEPVPFEMESVTFWTPFSADGRRGCTLVAKPVTDIWLIRNFGLGNH